MRNPPILISVLGFFTLIGAFYWIYLGLRLLGFDWFGALGDLPAFEQTGLWGWLALIAGIAFLAVGVGLWGLQEWAWTVAIIVSGFALFEAFLWFIEYPGSGVGLSAAIMPLLIIWYLNTGEVKAAFGKDARPPVD
jgi:hypothetical protein